MDKLELFEEITDYAQELAEFGDIWIRQGIDEVKFDSDESKKDEAFKILFKYLSDQYDNFIQEYAPDLFVEMRHESNIKWIEGNDGEEDNEICKNLGYNTLMEDTKNILISNKEEIIVTAVPLLYKFLKENN